MCLMFVQFVHLYYLPSSFTYKTFNNKFVQSNKLRKCLANYGILRQITKGSSWERKQRIGKGAKQKMSQNDRKKKLAYLLSMFSDAPIRAQCHHSPLAVFGKKFYSSNRISILFTPVIHGKVN